MSKRLNNFSTRLIRRFLPQAIKEQYINDGIKQGRKLALSGDNVYCPCCRNSFVTFLPAGLKKRANALCPSCGTVERHRLLWLYLENKTNLFHERIKLMHVAPERWFFRKFRSTAAIDYFPCAKFGAGYKDAYPEGTHNVDITSIQFSDNTFDVILCSHVLEHIPDDRRAMQELYRVLKPGGWAILQVPLDANSATTYEDFSITTPEGREKAFGQYDHVRVYGNDYVQRLADAGFRVKRDAYQREFSEAENFRYGFMPGEDIFYCEKIA